MLEFNVPVAAGPRVDDGRAARLPEGSAVRRVVAWSPSCVLALVRRRRSRSAGCCLDRDGDAGADHDPVAAADPTPAARRQRAARPGARAVLRPARSTGELRASGDECATLTVPLDYADPERRDDRARRAPGPGRRPGRHGSARWWSTPAAPARPARRTPRSAGASFGEPLLDHFDIVGFDPRGTGDSRPGRLPHRRRARRATSRGDPDPDTPAEVADVRRGRRTSSSARGCEPTVRRPGRPRLHDRGGPRHGRAAGGARRVDADLLRRLLRHQARRDVRRAVPRPGRPARPRRRRRPVARARASSALEQAAGFETALRAYVAELRRRRDDCFLGDTVDEGLDRIQRRSSTDVDDEPLPTARRPRARPWATRSTASSLPLYNRDYWILLDQGLQDALRRRRHARCCCSPTPTPRRDADGGYADNSHRGDLRDQLPRRPVVDPASTRCRPQFAGVRGGLADLRPGLRLGADRRAAASRPRSRPSRRDHRRRGRRADRGRRHHPRPGHAVRLGRSRSPTSSSPAC